MILQKLVDYYEIQSKNGKIPSDGWCTERVKYALRLNGDGELAGVVTLVDEIDGKEYPQKLTVPQRIVRAGTTPRGNFLCDNISYMLGVGKKGGFGGAVKCFQATKDLHLNILEGVNSEIAKAICNFFHSWDAAKANEMIEPYLEDMQTANLVFLVEGSPPCEDKLIQKAWNDYYGDEEDAASMRCLVTGEVKPVEIVHGKIKGIVGAQSAGASLVGFNETVFESFGRAKSQGLNSPISKYAASAYVSALNYLISSQEHSVRFGDTTVLFWGEHASPTSQTVAAGGIFGRTLEKKDQDQYIRDVMLPLSKGELIESVDPKENFYILGIAPNAARLSISFFWQSRLGDLAENVMQHHKDLKIIKGEKHKKYISINALLFEVMNKKSKNAKLQEGILAKLMDTAIHGAPYADTLYHSVLKRIRTEQEVTRTRVAIIKAYMIRRGIFKKGVCLEMSLDKNNRNNAYVSGRLFSVLENIQTTANEGIKATIKDRYFNSACSSPSTVFPLLQKLSNSHMKKLMRDKPGLAVTLEKMKGEIIDLLDPEGGLFPTNLSAQEQGLFIGGYYHQTQNRYIKKEDK